uniref:putative nuclease HARBI1 n=1 Tax=Pristiophorus japonicus TaxID=55135 RepID=UPI00398F76A5
MQGKAGPGPTAAEAAGKGCRDLDDDQCLRRLRFQKGVVTELCNLQADLEPQPQVRIALSVASKVTIALNFYATGSFQATPLDICNISQFAAHALIWEVINVLYRRRATYISFPMTRDKQLECQTGFLHIAGFPRIQEVIDCTYVGLRAPQQTPEQFQNRKGFHSPYVQLVYNQNCKIMQVDAWFPGSSHDSFILHQSGVPRLFTGPNQDCSWLLGDKGYTLRNLRTAAQHAYNDGPGADRLSSNTRKLQMPFSDALDQLWSWKGWLQTEPHPPLHLQSEVAGAKPWLAGLGSGLL